VPTYAQSDAPVERVAFSTTEVAAKFGVTRQHIQNLVARGDLPAVRLGRRILIPRSVVDGLLDGGEAS